MESIGVSPQYLRIAVDLASRVASGELREGQKIYGRSVMASEYNVSPETIRRALRLLADMKVVETKPQSGTVVLSADSARRYVSSFGDEFRTDRLRGELRGLMEEYAELNARLRTTVAELIKSRYAIAPAEHLLPNFEIPVPETSHVVGKSVGELKFWQSTGCTIAAIRRGRTVILSPGPYAELYGGDVIIAVGTPTSAEAAKRFVSERKDEALNDPVCECQQELREDADT